MEGEGIPAPGQKCEVHFEWRGREFRAEAEVVWKKNQREAGMRFLNVDENALQLLRQICRGLTLEPLEPLPPEPLKKT